jgi:hypothetical protein
VSLLSLKNENVQFENYLLKIIKRVGKKNVLFNLSVVVHNYNPRTQTAEAGGLRGYGQPELHSETLSQKKKKKNPTFQRSN